MKRLIATTTAVLSMAGIIATAAPANADPCQSGAVCAYGDENWNYPGQPIYNSRNDLRDYYNWTNAESIYNNGTSCNVYIYSQINRGGVRYPLNRGTGWRSIRGSAIWHHAYSNLWYGC